MITVFSILVLTLLFSFVPERFLKPKPAIVTRSVISITMHKLTVLLIFTLIFLLLQRPIFAGIVTISTLSVFVIVSNAKYKALREPLVYSDIAMFSQAFTHPRLYFPFLGIVPIVVVPLVVIGLIYAVVTYEPAIPFNLSMIALSIVVMIVAAYLIKRWSLLLTLAQQPSTDIQQYGLLASLWGYAYQARTQQQTSQINALLETSAIQNIALQSDVKPNVIVVQSESFFDARRMHPSIKTSVLKNFDQICEEAVMQGELEVPAWGANTMRTEFSFLTGIANNELGLYRFYPYHYLSNQPIPSLASYYQQQNYHCVCIHPHTASFFGRDKIFPNMGFDEFIDIESFDHSQIFGPYISDEAVTAKIREVVETNARKHGKPLFIFAITMENHGPLHLEKADKADVESFYKASSTLPQNHNDLTVYLRHLKNADRMMGDLRQHLKQFDNEAMLCIYGDHIPNMSNIYDQTSYTNSHSDYVIWSNINSNKNQEPKVVKVENLAELMFELLRH